MKTKVLKIPNAFIKDKAALKKLLAKAADLLLAGECVAFPTETVYGLGALALSPEAITKVFEAKGRPNDNPLIAHVNKIDDLKQLTQPLGKLEEDLIQLFSPGPITYVLRKQSHVPDALTAGLDTVAVRIPAKAVARALIALCAAPIAAPSANTSGMPSPTSAEHVLHDLNGKIPLIIDGGSCEFGLESTVLDLSDVSDIRILRPGAVTAERLIHFLETRKDFSPRFPDWRERLTQTVELSDATATPKAPGMKYKHYAPETAVYVLRGADLAEKSAAFGALLASLPAEKRLGLYASDQLVAELLEKYAERSLNSRTLVFEHSDDGSIAAQHFFAALRELDEDETELIVVEALEHSEVGTAYMNRLEKASGAYQVDSAGMSDCRSDVIVVPADASHNKDSEETTRKILFVCTGNTCRSPMAEALFNQVAATRHAPVRAESAGLAAFNGDEISSNAARVLLDNYGIDYSSHRSRRLNEHMLEQAQWVLTMTTGQSEALRHAFPAFAEKIQPLKRFALVSSDAVQGDISDPYGGDLQTYTATAVDISKSIAELFHKFNDFKD